jgi:DNA polymerase-3 subunit gamma/tau
MSYHVEYRPDEFEEVIGHDAVVQALSKIVKDKSSQAFLFSGPSGTGKTTLARICCKELGCVTKNILEIDAATHTGIDDMRSVQDLLRFAPFGKDKARALIIDECHRLSRQAWDSLLKIIEEPPPDVYWFFCTTEVGKVPQTIKTRCTALVLQEVASDDIRDLIEAVCSSEKITLAEGVLGLIVKEARGSPRQALVNLALCQICKNKASAAQILQSAIDSDPMLQLCQFIAKGEGSWSKAMALYAKLEDTNPESVRIMVVNYIGAALQKSTTERDACHFLRILQLFSTTYNPSEGKAPLLLSIGQTIFSGD